MTTVRVDLNNPTFQKQLFNLDQDEHERVVATLKKVSKMTWDQVQRDNTIRRARILSKTGPQREPLYAIRLARDVRGVGYRESEWLVLLTLHPDRTRASRRHPPAPRS